MPNTLDYDIGARRLRIGEGYIDGVDPRVWAYEVSGKQVLRQWFSYRKADRDRPLMGDRRPPSKLGDMRPDHWPAEYTTELLNVLHVLGRLVAIEPAQAALLDRICAGRTFTVDALRNAGALDAADAVGRRPAEAESAEQVSLLLD